MSEDEQRRKRERLARVNGDDATVAAVERDQARVGEGVLGFLDELIGRSIYVDGARIN